MLTKPSAAAVVWRVRPPTDMGELRLGDPTRRGRDLSHLQAYSFDEVASAGVKIHHRQERAT